MFNLSVVESPVGHSNLQAFMFNQNLVDSIAGYVAHFCEVLWCWPMKGLSQKDIVVKRIVCRKNRNFTDAEMGK